MVKEGFKRLRSMHDAIEISLSLVKEKGSESCPVENALGRVLAEDINAPIDVPHFDKAAMDGYAAVADNTFGASDTRPRELRVIERIDAGIQPQKIVAGGLCAEIATGAPMPEGADSVVMVEYTEHDGNTVKVFKPVPPGANVNRAGSDIRKGDKVIDRGTVLKPRHTGIATALGITSLKVKEQVRVGVISTGNELLEPGQQLKPGHIFDINSRTIIDAVVEAGGKAEFFGIAKDSKNDFEMRIMNAVKESDIVLLSGSSSLGAEDIMAEVLSNLGKVHVHGVAVKPGKPTVLADVDGKLVIGLPGYPASALSNFYILVQSIMDRMTAAKRILSFTEARLSRKVVSAQGRYHFLPVKLVGDEAFPVLKGSSAITTLSEADGFVEIEENIEVLDKGTRVRVRLF